ncbi:SigE family RNA polymerase sigma factor [Virgisporangium aurantiacum]|uniref:DNA-directed RNA polymerase sigma-70 factor n=1 Tax=Virgisporangium aurantiacum TaxID=175570 RepID=A0A8J4DXN8_9ACTN|nr:SigE family RNA polymerase sigma factor [Virgisporangium aurantiacum]GIJ53771.1 DNA-directed RNA polymerase sigma-70 factor [Virgisporangium aurantiacum]
MGVDRDGDFREFVLQRGHALSRVAFLLTGDHQLAEDLVQIALARAAARWPRLVAGGDPEPYVRRIMVNERTTWWRRRRYESVGRADCVSVTVGEHPTGVDETEQVNRRLVLVQALNRLSARQRAVVVLRYYVDLTVEETAQALGCSAGTVKSTTSDALSRLRATAADLGKVT